MFFNLFIQFINYLFHQPKDALTLFSAHWEWGRDAYQFKVAWVTKDDELQTHVLTVSVPLLFCVSFTIGLSVLNFVQLAIGLGQISTSGFTIDRTSASVYYKFNGYDHSGFYRDYAWTRIHGKPTHTSTVEEPIRVVFTQPASFGFVESTHELILTKSRVLWKWPRFWKRDLEVVGYDISVDQPPLVKARGLAALLGPHDGIYGMFASRVSTVDAAVDAYRSAVWIRRMKDSHEEIRQACRDARPAPLAPQLAS